MGCGCLLALLGLISPRVIIVVLWLIGFMAQAYDNFLIPLLGFMFLPVTTVVWTLIVVYGNGSLAELNLVWIGLAILVDLGVLGGGGFTGRRRK